MTDLTITIPDEVARSLRHEAAERCLSVDALASELLVSAVATHVHEPEGSSKEVVDMSGLRTFLLEERAKRKPVTSIDPRQFFEEIQKTKGFASKEEARQHLEDLRNEWSD